MFLNFHKILTIVSYVTTQYDYPKKPQKSTEATALLPWSQKNDTGSVGRPRNSLTPTQKSGHTDHTKRFLEFPQKTGGRNVKGTSHDVRTRMTNGKAQMTDEKERIG